VTPLRTADSDDTIHELGKYLSLPVTETDALQFWKQNENVHKLPKLALIARKLLAIPATSTPSERIFSLCGLTLNEHRARLSTETVKMLIFLKFNMQP
jgi:hAT family C-terminal dimerisation region